MIIQSSWLVPGPWSSAPTSSPPHSSCFSSPGVYKQLTHTLSQHCWPKPQAAQGPPGFPLPSAISAAPDLHLCPPLLSPPPPDPKPSPPSPLAPHWCAPPPSPSAFFFYFEFGNKQTLKLSNQMRWGFLCTQKVMSFVFLWAVWLDNTELVVTTLRWKLHQSGQYYKIVMWRTVVTIMPKGFSPGVFNLTKLYIFIIEIDWLQGNYTLLELNATNPIRDDTLNITKSQNQANTVHHQHPLYKVKTKEHY